ncbi:MAG: NAD-dependent epimerase/dehydratase family protein [Fidelibacterota bacterium]
MKALVTGAAGFLGGYLVEELLARGYEVRCMILPGEPLNGLEALPVEIVYGDVCIIDSLYQVVTNVDYIYHLAGVKGTFNSRAYGRVNVWGTKNLVKAVLLAKTHLRRFVFISSQAASGPSPDGHPLVEEEPCHPLDLYGKSKLSVEKFLLKNCHKIPISILRLSTCYGPRNRGPSMIGMTIALTRFGIMPIVGPYVAYMHIIHVRDGVQGMILAAESEHAVGQTYFITSPTPYTWQDVAKHCFRIWGKRGIMIPVHRKMVQSGIELARMYRKLRGLPVTGIFQMADYILQPQWVCSGLKAKRELGFEPHISLKKGLEETMRWYTNMKS